MDMRISKLMDSYAEEELEPVQTGLVDDKAVKARVLSQIPAAPSRRRVRAVRAAAALAACLALVAWTQGAKVYQMLSGSRIELGENFISVETTGGFDKSGAPLVVSLEDGRVWFVADGQRVDITEEIDEDTPYIYATQDDQGNRTCLVVGGTPDSPGWVERWEQADGSGAVEIPGGSLVRSLDQKPAWLVSAGQQLGIQSWCR